ncbi:MAG: hypothetical protein OXU44_04935, partial [Gammaproteobacteria bacterium]|nr:hypothetical protein [Gammaproteobacteria bacterium]
LIESETGEWTAVWTGAPSAEAVTMTVVFNGAAGMRRRLCMNRGSSAEFIGCTLMESEAAREDADVIFQQPLSSTMRSIVFNAPVRYGDRVSFRVKARYDSSTFFRGADGEALDSDGVEIEQGGETDEAFALHLEDAGGSRRSNAAVTIIGISNIGYIDGPSRILLDRRTGYNWNRDQNPEIRRSDDNAYRIVNFGFFYRVEAAALGGPVTRECQIATPADFGGAFPTFQTEVVPGDPPQTSENTVTDGGIQVTVRAADIVLADSGLCATKYFRVVQDPAREAFEAGQGPRGEFFNNEVAINIEPTRLINCGEGDIGVEEGGTGCVGAEPSSFHSPVSRLVAFSRTTPSAPQAGFLIARLGGDTHPNPNRVTGAAKGDAAAVTGQYLELLHSHYSGGRLVEGASRRFTVSYYGTTLSSPVTVPWHIEGIADADEQFERAAGFVTFPEGLAGGAVGQFNNNVRPEISGGTLTFPNRQFRYNFRAEGGRRMAFIEGGPIEIQRGIDITPRNDAVTEGEQSFRVVLGEPVTDGPALAGAGQFAEGVIAASDPIRQVLLDGPATLTPGEASTFTALWGGPAPVTDTAVRWQVGGDAAGLFSPAAGTVTFARGEDDADRTFTLTPMAAATTRTFSVSLTPMPATAAPPDIWSDVPATLTVGGQVVTTRLPTGVDHTGVADAIEGYAGMTGEFTVAQSAPEPAMPPSAITTTRASVAARSPDVREGGDISFSISLARATTAEVSVAWEVRAVSDGGRTGVELADLADGAGASLAGAQDGDGFAFGDVRGFVSTGTAATILTGTAVFAEADSVGTGTLIVTLPTLDDAVNEPPEALEMVLPLPASASAAGYIVGADNMTTATATVALHDNDPARISIERADADGFVEGPAGVSTETRTAIFRVRADGGPGFRLATTAMVSVLVSGAARGDFEVSADRLELAPAQDGITSAMLVVTATDNDRNEAPRTLL